MKLAVYFLSSIVDFASIIIFILSVFSFRPKLYMKEILIGATVLSVNSLLLSYFELRSIVPIVQILTMILLFIFLFKQKIMYSSWVVIFGYVFSGLLQAVLVGLLYYYKTIEINEMQPFQLKAYEMVLAADVILLILSVLLKNRYGFEFDENYNGKPIKTKAKVFWTVIFTTLILSCITGGLVLFHMNVLSLAAFLTSLLLLIIIFTLYSNKRNKEEFDI